MISNKKKVKDLKIPIRTNLLFFIVLLLFATLIVQLGLVQILDGESYQVEIDRTIQDSSKIPVPRGKIYDRNWNLLVDNKALYAISYTPPKRVQPEHKIKLAKELTEYLSIDKSLLKKITDRNKREYWYLENKEAALEKLPDEEIEEKKLDDTEQYNLRLKRITKKELAKLTDDDLKVIAIKRELDKAYSLTPEIIKNENISLEEYAKIAERLSELPGINVTTDWERVYPYGEKLKSILGGITSQNQGIPAEKKDYYLNRGYNRNDRVGKSGLEEQYEDLLRGRKEQVQYTTTKAGEIIGTELLVEGERGKDLILSIDMDFQEKVDEIVLSELKSAKRALPGPNQYLEDALTVVMNPKTGDILALSGYHYNKDKDEYEYAPHRLFYDAHRPGSTIKGATVLAGYESGVISPGQVFYDSPIKIASTPLKGSYAHLGAVNDINAIKLSSNVYMFYIALRFGGEYRHPFPRESSAVYNKDGAHKMRYYFNQFGLGVRTGIDFPYESTGVVGNALYPGNLMDLGIGQYDTYTTLQLAQYISTIANDGYRVQPQLVKEVRNPATDENKLGSIYKVNPPTILNRIEMSDDNIQRIQSGMYKVFNEPGGTGYNYWRGTNYEPAGKTGTAENEVYGQRDDGSFYKKSDTQNLTLVGYAPYKDPEVAFAVIVPNLGDVRGQYQINHYIGRKVLDAYFEMKEKGTKSLKQKIEDEAKEE